MGTVTESSENIECVYKGKKFVESNTETDPLMYFFENISTKEQFSKKETKLLRYSGLKGGSTYKITFLVWLIGERKIIRQAQKVDLGDFIFYIKNNNSIIKENLNTGEITNLSKALS